MAYRKKRRRSPGGIVVLFLALMLGLGVVVVQYERVQTQQEESRSAAAAAAAAHKQAFINRLAPYAQTLRANYGVLPSITLAQAILESNWGDSTLASEHHNLFGVKAGPQEAGEDMTTQEYVDGAWLTVTGRFKVYSSDYASMRDHAQLLYHGTSWNSQQYASVIAATDYKTAARALQTSGYATDPDYANKLIAVVEKYGLQQYDAN